MLSRIEKCAERGCFEELIAHRYSTKKLLAKQRMDSHPPVVIAMPLDIVMKTSYQVCHVVSHDHLGQTVPGNLKTPNPGSDI
jgi:hypothetical protein